RAALAVCRHLGAVHFIPRLAQIGIVIRRYSPPCTTALLCPTSFAGRGGIEDNWRESRSPLLEQGGEAAPIKQMPRSLLSRRRRGGFPFGFTGKPPRPRDKRMLRDIF